MVTSKEWSTCRPTPGPYHVRGRDEDGFAARPEEFVAYASRARRALAFLQMAGSEHAPVGGCFVPNVGACGDVAVDDWDGWVTDIWGRRLYVSEAAADGVVAIWRGARIDAGEEVFRIWTQIDPRSRWQSHGMADTYWKRS